MTGINGYIYIEKQRVTGILNSNVGTLVTFYIDEVFVKINGKQHYLWRAVDQDGEVVDVYLQKRRDGAGYEAIQIDTAGSKIRYRACCGFKSVQSG